MRHLMARRAAGLMVAAAAWWGASVAWAESAPKGSTYGIFDFEAQGTVDADSNLPIFYQESIKFDFAPDVKLTSDGLTYELAVNDVFVNGQDTGKQTLIFYPASPYNYSGAFYFGTTGLFGQNIAYGGYGNQLYTGQGDQCCTLVPGTYSERSLYILQSDFGTTNTNAFDVPGTLKISYFSSGPVPLDPSTPAVPEPASWALMIVGVGAIGLCLRRAKRVGNADWANGMPA